MWPEVNLFLKTNIKNAEKKGANIIFNERCITVDFETSEIKFENGKTVEVGSELGTIEPNGKINVTNNTPIELIKEENSSDVTNLENDKEEETTEQTPKVFDEEKSLNKEEVLANDFTDEQHFTQPPPRYSEASLVKKLEELGIGRPSTYASIISVISNRGYADVINKRFFPTDRGKLLSAFLEKLFSKYVDYGFTAALEDQLDDITAGKKEWIKVLDNFWKDFNTNVSNVKEKRTREVLDLLNQSLGELIFEADENGKINRKCKLCDTGELSLKNSFRGGAFIGCSNYPECKFTRPLSKSKANDQYALAEPKLIGQNDNGKDIYLKNGRFGPYLQYEIIEEETLNKKKTKVSTPQSTKMLYVIFFIMNLITIYFVSFSMEGKSLKCHFPLIVPSSIFTSPGLERTIVFRVVSSVK